MDYRCACPRGAVCRQFLVQLSVSHAHDRDTHLPLAGLLRFKQSAPTHNPSSTKIEYSSKDYANESNLPGYAKICFVKPVYVSAIMRIVFDHYRERLDWSA